VASSPNCVCHNGSFTPYVSRAGHSRGTTRCSKICALDRCGPKNTEPCRLHGSVNPIRDILLTTEKRSIAMQTADMIGCRRWQPIVLADEYLQSSPLPELPRSAKSGQRCRSRPTAVVDGRACCNLIGHCVFWFEFNSTPACSGVVRHLHSEPSTRTQSCSPVTGPRGHHPRRAAYPVRSTVTECYVRRAKDSVRWTKDKVPASPPHAIHSDARARRFRSGAYGAKVPNKLRAPRASDKSKVVKPSLTAKRVPGSRQPQV